jgi:8-oxo-dGTP diphosphatase
VSLVQASGTGLHLDSQRLMALDKRPDVAGWLAASCHDAQQLARAEALGCDFAVLGQVAETASHAGMPTLGWKQAASLIDAANIPVYCIGGMRKEDRPQAHACGAQGIAAIRGLWGV